MKEKANAWGNAQDRGSNFASERKQKQTSFGSYTKLKAIEKSNQMRSWILHRVNGQAEQLVDWNQINWVKVYKLIRNLQRRIFRARKLGQFKQLRRLQKLLLKSNPQTAIAIRHE